MDFFLAVVATLQCPGTLGVALILPGVRVRVLELHVAYTHPRPLLCSHMADSRLLCNASPGRQPAFPITRGPLFLPRTRSPTPHAPAFQPFSAFAPRTSKGNHPTGPSNFSRVAVASNTHRVFRNLGLALGKYACHTGLLALGTVVPCAKPEK